VIIPRSFQQICHRGFKRCSSLSSIIFSSQVQSFGDESSSGCQRIQSAFLNKFSLYIINLFRLHQLFSFKMINLLNLNDFWIVKAFNQLKFQFNQKQSLTNAFGDVLHFKIFLVVLIYLWILMIFMERLFI
jgi:hypothetical protein